MGPTASGKTALALELAERHGGEIVSVDSALVYRGLDIGAAKPDAAEQARVPHHMLDLREPWQGYSAAEFATDARAAIDGILARGRLPILAGGTGLYFRALLDGLSDMPPADPAVRAQLLAQTNTRPYEPDPKRTHMPASEYGAEWYGSAADICRLHAALQRGAVGEAAPVKDILSFLPGIDLDRAEWPYIGAKAGNLPGDMTFSWYAVDKTGQPWVVSLQSNWPEFRSQTAAAWLMSIARQTFDLIPRG